MLRANDFDSVVLEFDSFSTFVENNEACFKTLPPGLEN